MSRISDTSCAIKYDINHSEQIHTIPSSSSVTRRGFGVVCIVYVDLCLLKFRLVLPIKLDAVTASLKTHVEGVCVPLNTYLSAISSSLVSPVLCDVSLIASSISRPMLS
jgi:hypothetical protein